mmetsp:Transcript_6652/g.11191  ORF Transcript_6652/g.11191 Transcript_6652/m.11191 type:complete len:240 (-) Transcript_6652:1719-2438(-)
MAQSVEVEEELGSLEVVEVDVALVVCSSRNDLLLPLFELLVGGVDEVEEGLLSLPLVLPPLGLRVVHLHLLSDRIEEPLLFVILDHARGGVGSLGRRLGLQIPQIVVVEADGLQVDELEQGVGLLAEAVDPEAADDLRDDAAVELDCEELELEQVVDLERALLIVGHHYRVVKHVPVLVLPLARVGGGVAGLRVEDLVEVHGGRDHLRGLVLVKALDSVAQGREGFHGPLPIASRGARV